jgi:hypothetical protein
VDQDDGSNNQSVAFNLLLWGGAKNYLGFDKHFNGNLYLYPDANMPTAREAGGPLRTGFSPYCYLGNGGAAFPANVRDTWVNETCFASAGGSLYSSDCSPASPLDGNLPLIANNSLFLDTGACACAAPAVCGDAGSPFPHKRTHARARAHAHAQYRPPRRRARLRRAKVEPAGGASQRR